jgi:hypothetical protein
MSLNTATCEVMVTPLPARYNVRKFESKKDSQMSAVSPLLSEYRKKAGSLSWTYGLWLMSPRGTSAISKRDVPTPVGR